MATKIVTTEELAQLPQDDIVTDVPTYCPVCGDDPVMDKIEVDADGTPTKIVFGCGTTWETGGEFTVVRKCYENGQILNQVDDAQLYVMTEQLRRHYAHESLEDPIDVPDWMLEEEHPGESEEAVVPEVTVVDEHAQDTPQ